MRRWKGLPAHHISDAPAMKGYSRRTARARRRYFLAWPRRFGQARNHCGDPGAPVENLLPAHPGPMPTTYVVYKGRVPGVYDDWEDCRRQVHRFSGNSYKGYPTRVEAEGRYARYLAGEMRDMRRNRMKTMAFVMMVIVTMLVMFYVIVV
ncbi:hypothetical protein QYE76_029892 [Lolium multiflorum]|uniref:Ribonuclease H1 N-terminal domain-containing protein n=1 Tax=Lolium multiflorum TaxID=4521 RepID=A0AAD8QQL2_LOLMU|nr:hypothetical protein QYE76_029892 [Lolium multiflorum]